MTIYKIKIALYNKQKNMYNTSWIVKAIEKNMLNRTCVKKKITYSPENIHIEKRMRELLHHSIVIGVKNKMPLNKNTIFEVLF